LFIDNLETSTISTTAFSIGILERILDN